MGSQIISISVPVLPYWASRKDGPDKLLKYIYIHLEPGLAVEGAVEGVRRCVCVWERLCVNVVELN